MQTEQLTPPSPETPIPADVPSPVTPVESAPEVPAPVAEVPAEPAIPQVPAEETPAPVEAVSPVAGTEPVMETPVPAVEETSPTLETPVPELPTVPEAETVVLPEAVAPTPESDTPNEVIEATDMEVAEQFAAAHPDTQAADQMFAEARAAVVAAAPEVASADEVTPPAPVVDTPVSAPAETPKPGFSAVDILPAAKPGFLARVKGMFGKK